MSEMGILKVCGVFGMSLCVNGGLVYLGFFSNVWSFFYKNLVCFSFYFSFLTIWGREWVKLGNKLVIF